MPNQEQLIKERAKFLNTKSYNDSFSADMEMAEEEYNWFLSHQPSLDESELREKIVGILFENDRKHYRDRETFGELAHSILSLLAVKRPDEVSDFAQRIAKVFDEERSSKVFYFLQRAYPENEDWEWSDFQKLLDTIKLNEGE